ncbi:MAG: Gfo/Idh/MocA family oxidoreductase [Chloroflexota bacterium]
MTDPITPDWRIPAGAGRDLGIGIVGCGDIVRRCHLPAYLAAGLRVVAVTDADPARARALADDLGIPAVAPDAAALVATPGVDIVDIAVPPAAQPGIVALGAAAGRHLLCQKPFALDIATARSMVDLADRSGVRIAVNQQLRWSAGIRAARDLIARGVLGRPIGARFTLSGGGDWSPWPWLQPAPRLETMFHGIHYLDAIRSLFGDPSLVTAVHGRAPGRSEVAGETRTTTVLDYPDGRQALLVVDTEDRHGPPVGEMRFTGTDGTLAGTVGLTVPPDGVPDTLALHVAGQSPIPFSFDTRWFPDAFLGPMADLMDAVATGREPATSGRDNLGTLAVVLAAYRSAEERRSVRPEEILSA